MREPVDPRHSTGGFGKDPLLESVSAPGPSVTQRSWSPGPTLSLRPQMPSTLAKRKWALKQELEKLLPDATFHLAPQLLGVDERSQGSHADAVRCVLVKQVGPFMLRREYLAPDP